MNVLISKSQEDLGLKAANHAATEINSAIKNNGQARLLIATGASQFAVLSHLIKCKVDWSKVEVFHLDEYVDLSINHPASFRKYIKERFLAHVNVAQFYPIDTDKNIQNIIANLTQKVKESPIDVGLIGIGENGHIAFNDPPANFATTDSFLEVDLDKKCKIQQVNEGWFNSLSSVPDQAITMTVHQIMQCKIIISAVPHLAKAEAVRQTLTQDLTNEIPATILKTHKNWHLYLDQNSSSLLNLGDY